jgi:ATP-dependent helicase/nuclease subunit A
VKEVPRAVVDDRRRAYEAWRSARAAAREHAAVPSLSVCTAREMAAQDGATGWFGAVAVETVGGTALRPHGPAFGLLVHAVLADVPFDATRELVEEVARQQGRALGARDDDMAAAADAAAGALAHDLLARARTAAGRGRCRRETPVSVTLDDGTLVEGVVDLAFEEHDRWVVVDYKTDREIAAAGEERYRRQVALYARAIADATGRPADGVVLRV